MWTLENKTPFAAERAWVRDRNGAEVWLIAIRATFDLSLKGLITLAKEQKPVVLAPQYEDDNSTELKYESDFMPVKRATDVVLRGTAYAPKGQVHKQWSVNLKIGSIDKSLLISGDRYWQSGLLGLKISDPKPIAELPLRYHYAFGGQDPLSPPESLDYYVYNPIGRGYANSKATLVEQPLPNIETPSDPIQQWKQHPLPAGFEVIPGHWQTRLKYAGTYDAHWESHRQPLLPEDFDERFYQCVPEDQQVPGFLKGGEAVQLTHLTPKEQVYFHLPKASFHLSTQFSDGYKATHRTQLHTVIIEPDQQRLTMVWQSHLACHRRVNQLESTRITLKKRLFTDRKPQSVWAGPNQDAA